MRLYNPVIDRLPALFGAAKEKKYVYRSDNIWPETENYEMVLQRDMAYELGPDGRDAVCMTLVTTDPSYFDGDEVTVIGPDLQEIKKGAPYARIVLLKTGDIESDDEDDTEVAFRAIQGMDFVKYHVYPKGFMVRTSGLTNREQIRVSKKALKEGIDFEKIGNTFIRHYKENENVLAVKIIFITAADSDYAGMREEAKKASAITASLSKILKGMPTDCGVCGLKEICDEVEGLKELHFGRK